MVERGGNLLMQAILELGVQVITTYLHSLVALRLTSYVGFMSNKIKLFFKNYKLTDV